MYAKLFSTIVESSIWLEPHGTRIVWVTLLATMDEDGYAHYAAIGNLARRAGVTIEEAEAAVETLSAPEDDSSNKEHEGRRIERVAGGFMVLNAKFYRALGKREHELEANRRRVAEHRARKRVTRDDRDGNADVMDGNAEQRKGNENVTTTYAYADTENSNNDLSPRARPSTLKEVQDAAIAIGCPPPEAERFWHHFESSGWIDKNGHAVRNWRSKLAIWTATARGATAEQAHCAGGKNGTRPLSPMDLQTSLRAKETLAGELKMKHCAQVAMGDEWDSAEAKKQFFQLKREIKAINQRLASIA